MGVEWKKTVPVFALVLLAVVAGVVVAVVTRTSKLDVVGTYTGQNGREIKFAKDGTFTETGRPRLTAMGGGSSNYWVSGNSVTIGDPKAPRNVPPTFKVEENRLVGYGTVWFKQVVAPNRPSSLVGIYASSNGESLELDKNGAIYYDQQEPSGFSERPGTWVAGKDTVTVTYPDYQGNKPLKNTYTISGENLVGGGKEFVKKSDKAMTPPIPNYVMKPGSTAFRNPFSDIKGITATLARTRETKSMTKQ